MSTTTEQSPPLLKKPGFVVDDPARVDHRLHIALLTGGSDKPYALGLAAALSARGIAIDLIGSDELDLPAFRSLPNLSFYNLRGDQSATAGALRKFHRIVRYYRRLLMYARTSRATVFHILWNNRFEYFDRTLLMLFYRCTGKLLALTVHNVNAGRRDGTDGPLNRWSLRVQYRLADHLFVHTPRMKDELMQDFRVSDDKIQLVTLGVNNTVPHTNLSCPAARARLALAPHERILLFFGRISPYKGLEYLLSAFEQLPTSEYRLLIVGSVQSFPAYWSDVQRQIAASKLAPRILQRIEFIPDEDTELYFKAADVLVLPYTEVFQSGVLVLAYSFGLPVLAADVGSLADEIITGTTGYVFRARDSTHLAETIEHYFSSPLYLHLPARRGLIREHVNRAYSWSQVGQITDAIYRLPTKRQPV
jgi:glycosyltransferase involved in cell wall biosynthesis